MKKTPIVFCLFCIACLFSAGFAAEQLSADQLFTLMKSCRERYSSIEAVIENQSYSYDPNDSAKQTLKANHKITTRWTPKGYFTQADLCYFIPGQTKPYVQKATYYLCPSYMRTLTEESGAPPKGVVRAIEGQDIAYIPYCDVYQAMWALQGYEWEFLETCLSESEVEYDKQLNCYIVMIPVTKSKKFWLRITIDPAKDFIPISSATVFDDKTVLIRDECLEFQKINDMWVPLKYQWLHPRERTGGRYQVKSIQVNNLPDNKLDFSFPERTRVEDKLRGVEYVVKGVESPTNLPVSNNPAKLPPPATDMQLADAAVKARELIDKLKSATPAKEVSIDIYPSYVWVLPGKNEYSLSITADGGAMPGLVGHTFADGGLVLHSQEDRILAEGKIKVVLERPAELTGFADGVLELEFAGQKKAVHFVAAPTEKPGSND